MNNTFTVFTKPWKLSLPELGRHVAGLGFDGIELPVRPGYPVPPDEVATGLPHAVRVLNDFGLTIGSIAGPTDERTITACAEAGIPVIRICVTIPKDTRYFAAIETFQRQWDDLVPILDRHGVTIGIQNHSGHDIANAMQVHHAIARYDPRHLAAVWDPAHCALDGEIPEIALDILADRLCIVNLKNVIYRNGAAPGADRADWHRWWVGGREGLADWPRVARLLAARSWSGNLCLSAEYSEPGVVDRAVAEDLAYAKRCFEEAGSFS